MSAPFVEYKTGTPPAVGVYACRIPEDDSGLMYRDVFLMWHAGQWNYLRSDQIYRDEVPYWIGPLRRRMQETGAPP